MTFFDSSYARKIIALALILIALLISCRSSDSGTDSLQSADSQPVNSPEIPIAASHPKLPIPPEPSSDTKLFTPLLMGEIADSGNNEKSSEQAGTAEASPKNIGDTTDPDSSSEKTAQAMNSSADVDGRTHEAPVDQVKVLATLLTQPATATSSISDITSTNPLIASTAFITDELRDGIALAVIPLDGLTQAIGEADQGEGTQAENGNVDAVVPQVLEPIGSTSTTTTTQSDLETTEVATADLAQVDEGSVQAEDSEVEVLLETETPKIRAKRTVSVPILMYHYLSVPPADADIYRLDLSVTPEQFSFHLDAILEEGYTTISLYELWDHLENGAQLPEKSVVITFDDGYLDNYQNAFPLLIQRGMTATFFVVTDFMEVSRPGYFTWEMAGEMFDAGMSIESHGINHWSLQNRDDEFLVFQALRTKELIEAKIGHAPRFISYPAGEYDQSTIRIFQSANYLMGVTTIQGSTHDNDNMFELRRVRVRGTTDAATLIGLMTLDW